MDISEVSETLAEEFTDNPLNFITEEDIRIRFIEFLKSNLEQKEVSVDRDKFIEETEETYQEYDFNERSKAKQTYWKAIKNNGGKISRVHAEASVEKNKRIDAVLFNKEGDITVEWVQNGSKRFDSNDLEAAIELKFVKNKRYFPKNVKMEEIEEMNKAEIKENLDLEENSLYKADKNDDKGDIDELGSLPEHVDKFLLIFSNNNYLYSGEEPEEEKEYNSNLEAHKKLGEAAREKLKELGSKNEVSILYSHPISTGENKWINS